jgi:hypothetical protein
MTRFSAFVLGASLIGTPCVNATEILRLEPAVLARGLDTYVGKRISVRGCVITHEHGMQIYPCGSDDWRKITPLDDPKGEIGKALLASGLMEWDEACLAIEGVVIKRNIEWPRPAVAPALRVDKVLKVRRLGPNNSFKPNPLRGSA